MFKIISSNNSYANVVEAEKWCHCLANKYDIPVIGSYDAKTFDLRGDDFYDGVHPKHAAIQKIFSVIGSKNAAIY
jgi:hypothetical protein